MNEPLKLPFRLSVCGKVEIHDFVDRQVTHIVSIDNPGTPTRTPDWFRGSHWHVFFHDVENADDAKTLDAALPTPKDVQLILNFGRACLEMSRSREVHLLIHCSAGACRSPAAAFAILCLATGAGKERDCLRHVLTIRPNAFPNKLVVEHADQLLGRNGRMLEALQPLRNRANNAVNRWIEAMKKTQAGDDSGNP
jgi:predicted protein tyrosine phosphatase